MVWGKQNAIKVSVSVISPGRFLLVEKLAFTKVLPKPFSALPTVNGTLVEIKPSGWTKQQQNFCSRLWKD